MTPIEYTLRFGGAVQHYVDVDAVFATDNAAPLELMMAVWTPGSYMLREYARHVEAVHATDAAGRALVVTKTRKNRWSVADHRAGGVRLHYRVYCREMTVRNNWVEQDFAMLNGAATFLTRVHNNAVPHGVRIELPGTWKKIVTALPPHADGDVGHFVASDFDTLVDSPWLLGNPAIREFEVGGKNHVLATEGGGEIWDGARAAADTQKLVETNLALWGSLPYGRYVFINLLTEGRGGLEHKDSTVLMASRWAARQRSDYVSWLGLVSHEFFHVWNIKRLRPEVLGPFDYEAEAHTPSLWIAEGLTAYYDDLNVRRAGLSSPREYLDALSKSIGQLQTTPGRAVQTLAASSFDAWIKYYRRDENSDNSGVSYYTKGTLVGFLLDAKIRAATDGTKSLDDVMRLAFARYSGARGYTEAQFRALCDEVAGASLGEFFARAVDSTAELVYDDALAWFGLVFVKKAEAKGEPAEEGRADKETAQPKPGWLGISTRGEGGRLLITEIVRDAPAFAAGLNVDDELLAIDDYRVAANRLSDRLRLYPPTTVVTLLVARRERLVRLSVRLGEEPAKAWSLAPDPQATAEQQARLEAWLG